MASEFRFLPKYGAASVSDLEDVNITTLADNDILVWDDATQKWVNQPNSGGGGGSYPEVAAFANLPAASSHTGDIYVVQETTGIWLISRKVSGLYRSNGSAWVYLGDYLPQDVSTTATPEFAGITLPDAAIAQSKVDGLGTALSGKQNSLGFTPEDVANKDTSTTLGASNTKYPTQNAVKQYVDTAVGGISTPDHNDLGGLQGGDTAAYYHSNQEVNTSSDVVFASTTANETKADTVKARYVLIDGVGTVSTSGLSKVVTLAGGSFDVAGIGEGAALYVNGAYHLINSVNSDVEIELVIAADFSAGYSWKYVNLPQVRCDTDSYVATSISHSVDDAHIWEQYMWPSDNGPNGYPRYINLAWSSVSQTDNVVIHENGKIAVGGIPYDVNTGKQIEPESNLEIYCHPFDQVWHLSGSTYTDHTVEARQSAGTPFALLTGTSDYCYFGKYSQFRAVSVELAAVAASASLDVEYWNGTTWVALAAVANSLVDSTVGLTQSGYITWSVDSLTGWAPTVINDSDSLYFVRISASALVGAPTAYTALPLRGGRLAIYRAPYDTSAVFAVDRNGHTAIGKPVANASLDVLGEVRTSGSTSGHFSLSAPANGASISLETPDAAPVAGQVLIATSASKLSWSTPSGINAPVVFGDGSDGVVTISSNTSLTTPKNYSSLTVNNGVTLTSGNHPIFCSGTITNNGTISSKGGDGGASNGSGTGAAGGVVAAGFFAAGAAGTAGVAGAAGAGAQASAPAAVAAGIGGALAGTGAAGGAGSGGAGGGTRAGAVITAVRRILSAHQVSLLYATTNIGGGGGGGGGASGGGDGTNLGRGGGGGGAGGGHLHVWAKSIINNGTITVVGGNGGNGGPSATGNVGGGGGGGGGAGGCMRLVYEELTNSGTITAAGGSGGTGSAGAGTGTAGGNGTAGADGVVWKFNCTTGALE